MLSKVFLLAWYGSMWGRFQQASEYIRSVSEPDTNRVEHIITNDWFASKLITKNNVIEAPGNATTWLSPIRGESNRVVISSCLTENGKPRAGIVHFPYSNETWGIIRHEWLERPSLSFKPPETIVVQSKSEFVSDGYSVAVNKEVHSNIVTVLKGNALAYIQKSKLYTWDICALDLMTHALNGDFVQWNNGKHFNYTAAIHADGLFVSTTTSRVWFRLVSRMRDPGIRGCILLVGWFCLYLYPENALKKSKAKQVPISLVKCVLCIIACVLIRNAIQDHILNTHYTGERFESHNFLIFFGQLVTSLYAGLFLKHRTTPLFMCSVASITHVTSSMCIFIAMNRLSFPVVALIKSIRMLTVLLIGKFLFKKTYTRFMYLMSVALAGGVVLCLMSKYSSPSDALSPYTATILGLFLFSNGIFCQWQTYLYTTFNTPSVEMMWAISYCSSVFLGLLLFFSGELSASVAFCMDHLSLTLHLACLVLPTILEQWFAQLTLKNYGASIYAMVTTSSQAFALLGHSVANKNALRGQVYIGIVMVITTMTIVVRQTATQKTYAEVPQEDPEKGYDSLDEYELESDHED